MERRPSEKATAPASPSSPISAISRPSRPLVKRGAGQNANLRGVAGAPQDEVDHRRLVDRRAGVGPRHDRGDAARRRGRAGGGDRLAMLGARLADEGAHVDEAGRDDIAGAIDDPRVGRRRIRGDRAAKPGDEPADDQNAAMRLHARGGIDEAGVDEGARAIVGHGGSDSLRKDEAQPYQHCQIEF